MSEVCALCGKPAEGMATATDHAGQEIRLCHGDDTRDLSCYELHTRMLTWGGDVLLRLANSCDDCPPNCDRGCLFGPPCTHDGECFGPCNYRGPCGCQCHKEAK